MPKHEPQSIEYSSPVPRTITPDFTSKMQSLGYLSWRHELPKRTEAEIARVFTFNKHREPTLTEKQKSYMRSAGRSRLVVAHSVRPAEPEGVNKRLVGSVVAKSDVSGSLLERAVKHLRHPEKVYANIVNLAVHHEFREQGIQEELLRIVLRTFDQAHIPTTYIFEEDAISRAFYEGIGFEPTPADQVPEANRNYFGPERAPVWELRYAAPSVADILGRIAT